VQYLTDPKTLEKIARTAADKKIRQAAADRLRELTMDEDELELYEVMRPWLETPKSCRSGVKGEIMIYNHDYIEVGEYMYGTKYKCSKCGHEAGAGSSVYGTFDHRITGSITVSHRIKSSKAPSKKKLKDIAASNDISDLTGIAGFDNNSDMRTAALARLAEIVPKDEKAVLNVYGNIMIDENAAFESRLEAIDRLNELDSSMVQERLESWAEECSKSKDIGELSRGRLYADRITDQNAAQAIQRNITAALTQISCQDKVMKRRFRALEQLVDPSIIESIARQELDESALGAGVRELLDGCFGAGSSPSERQSIAAQYLTGPKTPIVY
jgi:hypothetical protein